MRLSDIASRARQLIDRRGGTESVKEDAGELRDIARGPGSLTEKAKEAAEALKEPGAEPGSPSRGAAPPPQPETPPAPRAARAGALGRRRRWRAGRGR